MIGYKNNRLYKLSTATGKASHGEAVDFGIGIYGVFGIATGYTQPVGFAINTATGEITYTGASAASGVRTLYARVTDGRDADNTASTAADDTASVAVTVNAPSSKEEKPRTEPKQSDPNDK